MNNGYGKARYGDNVFGKNPKEPRFGDNIMEGEDSRIEELHAMFQKAEISDYAIAGGLKLGDSGYLKIANKFNIDIPQAKSLYADLVNKLRSLNEDFIENSEKISVSENDVIVDFYKADKWVAKITVKMSGFVSPDTNKIKVAQKIIKDFEKTHGAVSVLQNNWFAKKVARTFGEPVIETRYAFEVDYLGNIVVRDGETGKEKFLSGSNAKNLISKLKMDKKNAQMILGGVLTESKQSFAAGCIILAEDTGRLLLAHRSQMVSEPNTWGTWGGGIEAGETPEDAVLRELKEEAGFNDVELVPLLVNKDYHNFLAITAKEFIPKLNVENRGYEWCEFGDYPSPLHFGLKELFDDKKSVAIILSHMGGEEHLDEAVIVESEDDFDKEITSTSGTYNFPWYANNMHGTATAKFSGSDGGIGIKIIDVRNDNGEEFDWEPFRAKIETQAKNFIDKV